MEQPVYLLPVRETISSAWDKVYGAKGTYWAALAIWGVIAFLLGVEIGFIEYYSSTLASIVNPINQAIIFLLQSGVFYISIQRARSLPISYKLMFRSFEYHIMIRLIGLLIVQSLIFIALFLLGGIFFFVTGAFGSPLSIVLFITIALILFTIGAYITLRMSLSLGLIVDKGVTVQESIAKSFEATRDNFIPLAYFALAQACIILFGVLTLLIGLIWMVPLAMLSYGEMYERLSKNIHNHS